jgi:hypothetical protein
MRHGADELAARASMADEAAGRSRSAVALVTAWGWHWPAWGWCSGNARSRCCAATGRIARPTTKPSAWKPRPPSACSKPPRSPVRAGCRGSLRAHWCRLPTPVGLERRTAARHGLHRQGLARRPAQDRAGAGRRRSRQAGAGAAPPLAACGRWPGPSQLGPAGQRTGWPVARGGLDQTELQTLRQTTTKAAEALREGQAELEAGRTQVATSNRWQASFLAALHQAMSPASLRLVEMAAQAQHGGVGPLDDLQRRHWASLADRRLAGPTTARG